jgi:hypothetical protein
MSTTAPSPPRPPTPPSLPEAQTLSGSGTNTFHHLVSEPATSLTLQRDITVTGNLAIGGGEFNDGGNTVQVWGHITNNGIHNSGINGKITLSGEARQDIGGGGIFGNWR